MISTRNILSLLIFLALVLLIGNIISSFWDPTHGLLSTNPPAIFPFLFPLVFLFNGLLSSITEPSASCPTSYLAASLSLRLFSPLPTNCNGADTTTHQHIWDHNSFDCRSRGTVVSPSFIIAWLTKELWLFFLDSTSF